MRGRCWSEHGAFRAAFIYRFPADIRPLLRSTGAALAGKAVAGDDPTQDEHFVLSEFRAALEDARMLRDYLRQIAEEGAGELESDAAEHLAREAWYWHRQTDDLAHGMAASLQNVTGEWPGEENTEVPGSEGGGS